MDGREPPDDPGHNMTFFSYAVALDAGVPVFFAALAARPANDQRGLLLASPADAAVASP